MIATLVKDKAHSLVDQMPENSTWDDPRETLVGCDNQSRQKYQDHFSASLAWGGD